MSKYTVSSKHPCAVRDPFYYKGTVLNRYRPCDCAIEDSDLINAHCFPLVRDVVNHTHACISESNFSTSEKIQKHKTQVVSNAQCALNNFMDFCYKMVSRHTNPKARREVTLYTSGFEDELETFSTPKEIRFISQFNCLFHDPRKVLKCLPVMDLTLLFSSFTINVRTQNFTYKYEVYAKDTDGHYTFIFNRKQNFNSCEFNGAETLQVVSITLGHMRNASIMDATEIVKAFASYSEMNHITGVGFCICNEVRSYTDPFFKIYYQETATNKDDDSQFKLRMPHANTMLLPRRYLNAEGVKHINNSFLNDTVFLGFYQNGVHTLQHKHVPLSEENKANFKRDIEVSSGDLPFNVYLVDNNNKLLLSELPTRGTHAYDKIIEYVKTISEYFPVTMYHSKSNMGYVKYDTSIYDVKLIDIYLKYTGRKLKYDNKYCNAYSVPSRTFVLEESVKNLGKVERFLERVVKKLKLAIGDNVDFVVDNTQQFPLSDKEMLFNLRSIKPEMLNDKGLALKAYTDQYNKETSGIPTCFNTAFATPAYGLPRKSIVSLHTFMCMYFPSKGSVVRSMLSRLAYMASSIMVDTDYSIVFKFLNRRQQECVYVPFVGLVNEFLRANCNSIEVASVFFVEKVYNLFYTLYTCLADSPTKVLNPSPMYVCSDKRRADWNEQRNYESALYLISRMNVTSYNMHYEALADRAREYGVEISYL